MLEGVSTTDVVGVGANEDERWMSEMTSDERVDICSFDEENELLIVDVLGNEESRPSFLPVLHSHQGACFDAAAHSDE